MSKPLPGTEEYAKNCQHVASDRREGFSQAQGKTVYWCMGCCKGLEFRRHPVTGVLLEVVAT